MVVRNVVTSVRNLLVIDAFSSKALFLLKEKKESVVEEKKKEEKINVSDIILYKKVVKIE